MINNDARKLGNLLQSSAAYLYRERNFSVESLSDDEKILLEAGKHMMLLAEQHNALIQA